jgi:GNAT superfamily N-acetyltransferase
MGHALLTNDLELFCSGPEPPNLTVDEVGSHGADAHCVVIGDCARVTARCSLWWRSAPRHLSRRVGVIGHYVAHTAEAAAALLATAGRRLAEQGCSLAVGPMDGNTWRRYRLITERGPEPIFFLEPDHPHAAAAHFTRNGFAAMATYFSSLSPDLNQHDPKAAQAAARLREKGIGIRSLDRDAFVDELRRIHSLSLESFRDNFLYTPIGEAEFLAMYLPLQPCIDPRLVVIAEHDGLPVGFMVGIPDLLQARAGRRIDTVILKTLAVHPDYGGLGIGRLLVAACQERARHLGYRRAISALIREDNMSVKLVPPGSYRIRRYTLFGKELTLS